MQYASNSQLTLINTKINEPATRNKAKSILRKYRQLNRLAAKGSSVDLRSPLISDMPRAENNNRGVSDSVIIGLDASIERDKIDTAIAKLSLESRLVLYYSYCTRERFTISEINDKVNSSDRTIDRIKSNALLEFSEAYQNGILLVFDESKMA